MMDSWLLVNDVDSWLLVNDVDSWLLVSDVAPKKTKQVM